MTATSARRVDENRYSMLYSTEAQVSVTVVRDRERNLELTSDATVLRAPARLVSETRAEFRQAALDLVARAAVLRVATVTVDLARTEDIDASGLGILVLMQRRARDHRVTVRLVGVRPAVRQLMELTRLDYLFHMSA